jgi:hypothetical protein
MMVWGWTENILGRQRTFVNRKCIIIMAGGKAESLPGGVPGFTEGGFKRIVTHKWQK